jgi:hypothetical protein
MDLLNRGTSPCLPPRLALVLLTATLALSGCSMSPPDTRPGERAIDGGHSALGAASLANATYPSLMLEGARVTLAGGRLHDAERGLTFTLLADHFAAGEIDGAPVAAVLLAENGGGTGTFISLVLFGVEAGEPAALATAMLGDRPRVQHVAISDEGAVIVQMVQVGANDRFCCPATPMTVEYVYAAGKLQLRTLSTASIDVAGYANQANVFMKQATPYDRSEPPGGQGEPAHFAWTFDDNLGLDLARAHIAGTGYVAVFPVAPYQASWDAAGDSFVADTLATLAVLLEQQPGNPPLPLPVLPLQHGVNDFAARVAYLELPDGGRGMRFVGRIAQDAAPLRNDQLRYFFHGLSADGAALVVASLPIATTALAGANMIAAPDAGPAAGPGHADRLEHWRGILDELQPSAFEPSLETLDALMRSVTLSTEHRAPSSD